MIEDFRRFLSTTGGKIVAAFLTVCLLGVAVYEVKAFFRGDTPSSAFSKMYIDRVTGKPYAHQPAIGDPLPLPAPSGGNTGMPAEACYWSKDGKPLHEPHWVLLNSEKDPPSDEPTFCPVCGHLVVGHNPQPVAGKPAPPTRDEWLARHPSPTE